MNFECGKILIQSYATCFILSKKSKRKNSTRDLLSRTEVCSPQCYLDMYVCVTSVTSGLRIGNEEWQKNSGCEGQSIQYLVSQCSEKVSHIVIEGHGIYIIECSEMITVPKPF